MDDDVDLFEAATKLGQLLRDVQSGRCYTITVQGEAIADLVPSKRGRDVTKKVAVEQMLEFASKRKPIEGLNLKDLIEEGRS